MKRNANKKKRGKIKMKRNASKRHAGFASVRDIHQPTNQSFRVCKVNLATRKVAITADRKVLNEENESRFAPSTCSLDTELSV